MPVVWLIDAYRAGERAQLRALVEALGWPLEIKSLSYRKYEFLTNVFRGSDLRGIHTDQSSPLQAPWPELLISSGLRNEPVCRWIRDQAAGKTKIVHVGKTWADPSCFDLVVTTPQYHVPLRDNVLQNSLTLHQVSEQRLQQEGARWRTQFEHLPAPHTALCVGGDSGPFTFGPKAAARLAQQANELVQRQGGSLLVSTSSRTSPAAAQALEHCLEAPHYFYRWRPGDDANPYFGILGLADQFIVTADSISMLSEACASGRPVFMFDLGSGRHAMQTGSTGADSDNDFRLGGLMYRGLMRWGWQPLSRDISLVHENLVESGRAAWSGEMSAAPAPATPTSDLDAAVAAVRALFQQGVVDS
jgi:mitochondrial fission protein ELM1